MRLNFENYGWKILVCVIAVGVSLALLGNVAQASDSVAEEWKEFPERTRPPFHGTKFMATGTNPQAIMAGAKILEMGGNATDAGIAIAAASNIVDMGLSGIGGDSVLLIYDAEEDKMTTIEGIGWAPENATVDYFIEQHGEMPLRGPFSVDVPGTFSSWIKALDNYGTMSLAEVLQPAIELAEEGHPLTPLTGGLLEGRGEQYPYTHELFTDEDGEYLGPGDIFVNPDLATTFRKLAAAEQRNLTAGRSEALQAAHDLFYKGEIAEAIVEFLQEQGHIIEYEDFADYEAVERPPINTTYRDDYTVYQNPPSTQGHVKLQTLNVLEGYDIAEMGRSADYYHLLTEALKLAFRDRHEYIADPRFIDIPIEGLLSKDYAEAQRERIDPDEAMEWPIEAGDPWEYQDSQANKPQEDGPIVHISEGIEDPEKVIADAGHEKGIVYDGETQHWTVVDEERNVFAHTGSINYFFGSEMAVPGYGFLLNNRLPTHSLDPESIKAVEPRKRPLHTIQSTVALKNGKPFISMGTPGGDRQVQGTTQVFINVVDFGMDIQTAIEQARGINTQMMHARMFPMELISEDLEMEITVGEEIIEEMKDKGHQVVIGPPLSISGNLSAVLIDQPDGTLKGGSDPRREGYVIGW